MERFLKAAPIAVGAEAVVTEVIKVNVYGGLLDVHKGKEKCLGVGM